MEKNLFSLFEGGIKQTIPTKSISIVELISIMESDQYAVVTQNIRNESDKDARNILKRSLPYVTFNGIFKRRKDIEIIEYSQLLVLDFDELTLDTTLEKFEQICQDNFVHFAFISPSGLGIKVVVKINTFNIKSHWINGANYFLKTHDLIADESGKDISRASYICKEKPYFNPDSYVFQEPEIIVDFKKSNDLTQRHRRNTSNQKSRTNGNSELKRAQTVVERICDNKLDIFPTYDDWLNLGFSLAIFGEEGRSLYHDVSYLSEKYEVSKTDAQFDNCKKATRFTNAGFMFKRAKSHGIIITKNINAENSKAFIENNEVLSNGQVTYFLQDYQIQISSGKTTSTVAEGFLFYLKFQTTDENEKNSWIAELKVPTGEPIYVEISHDDFFEPKTLERILGAKRLSMAINYGQLQKLRTFLFNSTNFPNANKITRYGLEPESELYFFSNCAISKKGQILYPNNFGIIEYNNLYFSLPKINKGVESPFSYIKNDITFNAWYLLFEKAQRDQMTFLSASFLLFSIFRDIGIKVNNFSPMLYIYGIAGTAKSTLFVHLNYIFGSEGKSMGINLKGKNTEPAFLAKIEQRYNGFQFGDEYKPQHTLTPLFQASYDNKGYSKMNMNANANYLETIDLVPKCTIGFASNFLPQLPEDEPFFSRLVLLINNNRERTDVQKKAYQELLQTQENGITNILREVWQYRDLINAEFKTGYLLLKEAFEAHFQQFNIGNPRYIYNVCQILTIPFILSKHGKINMCESTSETDLIKEFISKSEASILSSDRLVQDKSALREFFDIIQDMYERNLIVEFIHFKFDQADIIINMQRLYSKFCIEFKKINKFEIQPPDLTTLQDEILHLLKLDTKSEDIRNAFFKKTRFNSEIEIGKIDYARSCFKINYQLIQDNFGINLKNS